MLPLTIQRPASDAHGMRRYEADRELYAALAKSCLFCATHQLMIKHPMLGSEHAEPS